MKRRHGEMVSDAASYGLEPLADRLQTHSLLTRDDVAALLSIEHRVLHATKRHEFDHVDDDKRYASFVVHGFVARFVQTPRGTRQITSLHVPGEVAGLDRTVRDIVGGGLQALSDTVLLRLHRTALARLTDQHPAIGKAFWRENARELAISAQWLTNVGRRDAQARIAHLLCEMAFRCGTVGVYDLAYTFPLTQEQLGEVLALTSVHVNRSLKALGGIASVRGGHVEIHDWNALTRAGEFAPTYLVATRPAD